MRFILKLVLCVSIYLSGIASALAVEVVGSQHLYRPIIERLVVEKIIPTLSELSVEQYDRLHDVQISIVDNMRPHAMALALDEKPPRVIINSRFISDILVYSWADEVAKATQKPEFVEHYFHFYLGEISSGVRHSEVMKPHIWAGLDPAAWQPITQMQQSVFEGALLDVLLHELGHHAEYAFYSYRSNELVKKENEELADKWAQSFKARHLPLSNPLGQLVSIAFIFERDRWAILSKDRSYPRMLPWVVDRLPELCEDATSSVKAFCIRLEGNIENYMTNRIERAYSKRIEQGEDFARFPMAQILLAKNNFVDACNYFNESLIYGQVSRAAIYVGWCYQKGFLENSPPDAEVLAMANLRGGIGYGYSDKVMVERFF